MDVYINLKHKSNQNYEIANFAKQKKYYDVAVSRYYYSLFQLIDYILYSRDKNFIVPQNVAPHAYTIKEFNKFIHKDKKCKKVLTDENIAELMILQDLKRWRQDADYKNRFIKEEEFINEFMKKYEPCYKTINEKIVCQE